MKVVFPLITIVLIFSSCQKIMEYYSLNSHEEPQSSCRVTGFTTVYLETVTSTNIQYNSAGRPVTITYFADWLPDGSTIEKLHYDKLGRLILHEPDLLMGNIRKYVYEGSSTSPLRDTATDFLGKKYLETFKTDAKGRIIEEEIKWIYSPPDLEDDFEFQTEVHRFYYDAYGNRQVNPFDYPWHKTIKYSKQPSIYSLHPTWQIIHRDYSKNSIYNIGSSNEHGLPLTFKYDEFAYWQPFLDMSLNSVVEYSCGPK